MVEKVIVMGAAGRDFHNFNIYFRGNPRYQVVAFTATQIPSIEGRCYPPELAGEGYPRGIPIYAEAELPQLIKSHRVDLVAFCYSDVTHLDLMHKASRVMALGADFILIGATYTMLRSRRPVVSVCAVRTGCGKSQTTRRVCDILTRMGQRLVVVRHPMPYGDLGRQAVQRFATYDDLERHACTIEEREEYEPLLEKGLVVYAGVDYARILQSAEQEAEVIVWDGGNNDTPFFLPSLHIVVFDPLRAGHELLYYPGETNLLMTQVAVINKVDSATPQQVEQVRGNIERHAPGASIVLANSPVTVEDPARVAGQRVLVVEDGPTLTHGGMAYGAGAVAARQYGAAQLVDVREVAVGSIAKAFRDYPHIGPVLPAVGYTPQQVKDLEATISRVDCDLVLFATPIELTRLLAMDKPVLRVRYEYQDHGQGPSLEQALRQCQCLDLAVHS
jgi:predicted GTPase